MKKSIRSRGVAALGVAGLTLGLGLVMAPPASAAVFDCASGRACGWHDGSFTGTRYDRTATILALSSTHDNKFTSLANNTTKTSYWYVHPDLAGNRLVRAPGTVADDLVWLGFNDAISSILLT